MTHNEEMQKIWKQYIDAGMTTPTSARDVAAWAIENRLWSPKPVDVIAQCAEDLSKALREEYRTDKLGRRYRAKHAVRVNSEGKQLTLWSDIDTAPRAHMEKAFAQRRQQIIGDCHQLKIDVDCYNDARLSDPPIQLVLDFTMDIAELEITTINKKSVL